MLDITIKQCHEAFEGFMCFTEAETKAQSQGHTYSLLGICSLVSWEVPLLATQGLVHWTQLNCHVQFWGPYPVWDGTNDRECKRKAGLAVHVSDAPHFE